jgi:hypothetical protein
LSGLDFGVELWQSRIKGLDDFPSGNGGHFGSVLIDVRWPITDEFDLPMAVALITGYLPWTGASEAFRNDPKTSSNDPGS